MNLGLETDVTNPNFAGAIQSPDSVLHVEFFMGPILDQHKSQQAGKRVYRTKHVPVGQEVTINMPSGISSTYQPMKDTGEVLQIPQIRIQKPGDSTSIIERAVIESDKHRWPNQWLYFAGQNGLIEGLTDIPGWKIEEWEHVNTDTETVRNLKYMRFFTVEQIAGASDAQVQKLGMGGAGLRRAAQDAIRGKFNATFNNDLAAKDKQIAEMNERMRKLEEMIAAPQEKKNASPAKRKYTKRAKPEATA